ncbi:hypothetical protein LTR53_007317 [Teratosphaeriaceae sp. CCFEE 6253]|nr:hypothetical protein LTR53_007317 [Teratosphaeriaceae sp. CCFEE 6253]
MEIPMLGGPFSATVEAYEAKQLTASRDGLAALVVGYLGRRSQLAAVSGATTASSTSAALQCWRDAVTESRVNVLRGFEGDGICARLPPELRNLVVEMLAESADGSYEPHGRIEVTMGPDIDAICERLMPSTWQDRLEYGAAIRQFLLDDRMFEPTVATICSTPASVQPWVPDLRDLGLTIRNSLGFYSTSMTQIHLDVRIVRPEYVVNAQCWPTELYAYQENIMPLISACFPSLLKLRVVVVEDRVDRYTLMSRHSPPTTLTTQSHALELVRLVWLVARLRTRSVFFGFSTRDGSAEDAPGPYLSARRRVFCRTGSEGTRTRLEITDGEDEELANYFRTL